MMFFGFIIFDAPRQVDTSYQDGLTIYLILLKNELTIIQHNSSKTDVNNSSIKIKTIFLQILFFLLQLLYNAYVFHTDPIHNTS